MQDVVLVREDDVAVEVRVATAAAVAVALKTFKVSVVLVGCEGLSDVPLPLLPLHFGHAAASGRCRGAHAVGAEPAQMEVEYVFLQLEAARWHRCAVVPFVLVDLRCKDVEAARSFRRI